MLKHHTPVYGVTLRDDKIYVYFRYNADFVEDCRAIEGRRWDGTANVFPASSVSLVRALADKWNIPVSLEVELLGSFGLDQSMSQDGKPNVFAIEGGVAIRFDYNPNLIGRIKHEIPGVGWNGEKKHWVAPLASAAQALVFAESNGLTVDPTFAGTTRKMLSETRALYDASTSLDHPEIEIPGLAMPLRPFQRAGVAYLSKVRRAILGDQPGLGKSVQSTSTVVYNDALPMVVVCPNTLKYVWQEDIGKFYPDLRVSILSGTKSAPVPEADVIVINYDIAASRVDDIKAHGYNSLVVDESHAIKNGKKKSVCPHCEYKVKSNSVNCSGCGARGIKPRTFYTVQRTDAVMRLAKHLGKDSLILLLTGTPINNRPEELIRQLEAIDRLDQFGGEWRFRARYCPDRKTSINLLELNTKLRESCFIRRLKKDVYQDLPDVQNSVQRLIVSDKDMKRYRAVEDDAIEYFANKARERARDAGMRGDREYWSKRMQLEQAEALIRIAALRDAVSQIKYDAIIDWLDNFLESGEEKIIVFAEHIELVEMIYARYQHMALKVRGGSTPKARNEMVRSFQTDPQFRVFVANMTAAKEGLTLTESSDVIFCELAWSPTIHEQCVGRSHGRVNNPHGTNAWYLLAPGTIDYEMYDLLQKKQRVIDAATDGIDPDGPQTSIEGDLIKYLEGRADH